MSTHAADGHIHSAEIGGIVMQNNEHVFEYLPGESGDTLWPSMSCINNMMYICTCVILFPADKLVPYDGVPNTIIDTVGTPLAVVIDLLALAGILFALGCLAFNFVYRKSRYMLYMP